MENSCTSSCENCCKKIKEIKARRWFNRRVLLGRIDKMNCQICNSSKSIGHHEDYSKPFDVIWLCRRHHSELHAGKKFQNKLTIVQYEKKQTPDMLREKLLLPSKNIKKSNLIDEIVKQSEKTGLSIMKNFKELKDLAINELR